MVAAADDLDRRRRLAAAGDRGRGHGRSLRAPRTSRTWARRRSAGCDRGACRRSFPPRHPDGTVRRLIVWSEDADLVRRATLDARGFEPVRQYFEMAIGLDEEPAPPKWPPGIEARAFRPGVDDAARMASGSRGLLRALSSFRRDPSRSGACITWRRRTQTRRSGGSPGTETSWPATSLAVDRRPRCRDRRPRRAQGVARPRDRPRAVVWRRSERSVSAARRIVRLVRRRPERHERRPRLRGGRHARLPPLRRAGEAARLTQAAAARRLPRVRSPPEWERAGAASRPPRPSALPAAESVPGASVAAVSWPRRSPCGRSACCARPSRR